MQPSTQGVEERTARAFADDYFAQFPAATLRQLATAWTASKNARLGRDGTLLALPAELTAVIARQAGLQAAGRLATIGRGSRQRGGNLAAGASAAIVSHCMDAPTFRELVGYVRDQVMRERRDFTVRVLHDFGERGPVSGVEATFEVKPPTSAASRERFLVRFLRYDWKHPSGVGGRRIEQTRERAARYMTSVLMTGEIRRQDGSEQVAFDPTTQLVAADMETLKHLFYRRAQCQEETREQEEAWLRSIVEHAMQLPHARETTTPVLAKTLRAGNQLNWNLYDSFSIWLWLSEVARYPLQVPLPPFPLGS
jgi:hypothetical protein